MLWNCRTRTLAMSLLGLVLCPIATLHAQPAGHPGGDRQPGISARPAGAHAEMILFAGGEFLMGFDQAHDDEKPVHPVRLKPYYLDRYEVTNAQFAAFVEATGHVTQAQRDGYAWGYRMGDQDFSQVVGATWRSPDGPGSTIDQRMDHPVVCVSWHDAVAYAAWAGKRLPTEAEWEFAARGGGGAQVTADPRHSPEPTPVPRQDHADHHAGHGNTAPPGADPLAPQAPEDASHHPSLKSHLAGGNHAQHAGVSGQRQIGANVWYGNWPHTRTALAGYTSTTPVGTFHADTDRPADMIGNVWEWTGDWYDKDYYHDSPDDNPRGAESGTYRVARGGSWFCSPEYCSAYNSHYRGASPPDHAFTNVGFRCAADADTEQP